MRRHICGELAGGVARDLQAWLAEKQARLGHQILPHEFAVIVRANELPREGLGSPVDKRIPTEVAQITSTSGNGVTPADANASASASRANRRISADF